MGLTTYDISTNWADNPYGLGDSPGLVATSGYTTGVMTDDGPIGTPMQSGQKASLQNATPQGNPIVGLVIAFILLVVLMLIVHHFGKASEDFKNIKASAYNAGVIGFAAMVMIPLFKMFFSALATTKLPGTAALNTYASAA